MHRRWNFLTVLATASLVSCGHSWFAGIPRTDSLTDAGRIDGCRIKFGELGAYHVQGPDGVSPLIVDIGVTIDNSNGHDLRLSWKAYVVTQDNDSYDLNLAQTGAGPAWTGEVLAGTIKSLDLHTDDGPRLPPYTGITLAVKFTDAKGSVVWLGSRSGVGEAEQTRY